MDRIRSFFEDLGIVLDEELVGKTTTDSDKSSDDDNTTDEERMEVRKNAAPSSNDVETKQSQPSSSVLTNLVRRPSFILRKQVQPERQRSVDTLSPVPRSLSNVGMKRIANSIVEETDDENNDDDLTPTTIPQKKARSFTRFQLVRSTRSMDIDNNKNSNINSERNVDTKNDEARKVPTIINDGALDDTPANLFGYACGIEFCSSMELINKIQGTSHDDHDTDDEEDNDDNIMEESDNKTTDKTKVPSDSDQPSMFNKRKGNRSIKNAMKSINRKSTSSNNVTTKSINDTTTIDSSSTTVTKKHISRWGHSKVWTSIALLFAITGCVCAILSRQSLHFVTLRNPLIITDLYEPITHIGMIRIRICTNTSTTATSTTLGSETIQSLEEVDNNSNMADTNSTSSHSYPSNDESKCTITRLSREEVSDKLFNLSRSLLTLGSFLGIALTGVLTTSILWESINLRPLAIGYLVSYFFQSFSLLFLNTELCIEYKCRLSTGGYLSIITSICWIGTLISVVRMDIFKYQTIRLRLREKRRAKREARRQQRKAMIKKQQQERNEMMIIENFHNCSMNSESVDALDIEAVFTSEEEYQAQQNEEGKKWMRL